MDKRKKFNQKIDCSNLNEFNDIIYSNECFRRKIIKRKISNENYRYQYYNQLCTCIGRIRETSNYLENYEFKQKNLYGQAFDFYEFVNCLWIIYGCTETLFTIFGLKLEDYLKDTNCFKNSNKIKFGDIKFFKFIRSAASAHPAETTRYRKITKHKLEVYPYASWRTNSSSALSLKKGGTSDIELLSWNSSTKGKNKRYYIYIDEFYHFINCVVKSISNLIPAAKKVIEDNIEKLRCKRLKKATSFDNYHDYLIYLRNRLKKIKATNEFLDGGILLADHLLQNNLISNKFKKYVKKQVEKLSNQMLTDITVISFYDIFDDLDLLKVLKDHSSKAHYISEKYNDYLYKETIHEIKTGVFIQYITGLNEPPQKNAYYAVTLLESVHDILYSKNQIKEMMTYADIYEITLQNIYLLLNSNKEKSHTTLSN